MEEIKPKYTIKDLKKFDTDRAKMGYLILEGMKASGGTDIDWLVEHRGGFLIMENKTLHNDLISIKWGQMIAFEKLHEKLNSDGKCHFIFWGYEDGMDYKNPDSSLWYFEMSDWKNKKIPFTRGKKNNYLINRNAMIHIKLKEYRKLIEKIWREFEL